MVTDLMLDELNHIRGFDHFEWNSLSLLGKAINNRENEPLTF